MVQSFSVQIQPPKRRSEVEIPNGWGLGRYVGVTEVRMNGVKVSTRGDTSGKIGGGGGRGERVLETRPRMTRGRMPRGLVLGKRR
jgi:hypothetical protein